MKKSSENERHILVRVIPYEIVKNAPIVPISPPTNYPTRDSEQVVKMHLPIGALLTIVQLFDEPNEFPKFLFDPLRCTPTRERVD
ncbi:MAG: hypothetical protein KGI73_03520 [Patescibacteria group bacterium]|nr:hypothetical protein [Patescibacteria group bacterium]